MILICLRTSGPRSMPRRKTLYILLLVVLVLVVVLALAIGLGVGLGTRGSTALYKSVKGTNLVNHLKVINSLYFNNYNIDV